MEPLSNWIDFIKLLAWIGTMLGILMLFALVSVSVELRKIEKNIAGDR